MTNEATQQLWQKAQGTEFAYWQGMTLAELLRISMELRGFVERMDPARLAELFDDKEVLEIGCGPIGLSVACFYRDKTRIRRLVKVDPLPQLKLNETPAYDSDWARTFVSWVAALATEGDYVQTQGEHLAFQNQFDTVISYNVIDHVQNPLAVLEGTYAALRGGGTILVGVDCLSLVGRLKFEHYTRRVARGSILVDAHPHSFRWQQVATMLRQVGFLEVECLHPPPFTRQIVGHAERMTFVGRRPRRA